MARAWHLVTFAVAAFALVFQLVLILKGDASSTRRTRPSTPEHRRAASSSTSPSRATSRLPGRPACSPAAGRATPASSGCSASTRCWRSPSPASCTGSCCGRSSTSRARRTSPTSCSTSWCRCSPSSAGWCSARAAAAQLGPAARARLADRLPAAHPRDGADLRLVPLPVPRRRRARPRRGAAQLPGDHGAVPGARVRTGLGRRQLPGAKPDDRARAAA